MLTRRSWLVYGALVAIWMALIGWQVVEHVRVRHVAEAELIVRARNVSSDLARFVRVGRFRGSLQRNRLQPILDDLVKPGELNPRSVLIVNAQGEELVSAGETNELQGINELQGGVRWDPQRQTMMLMNVVDWGAETNANIITSPEDRTAMPRFTNAVGTNLVGASISSNQPGLGGPGGPVGQGDQPPGFAPPPPPMGSNQEAGSSNMFRPGDNRGPRDGGRRGRGGGGRFNPDQPFERPFWMGEAEYSSLIQKQGVSGFVVVMPTASMSRTIERDLWLRIFVGFLATISVAGYGLAWGNLEKTSVLQIRLVRASELNTHLKDMNLAAAGLAHETRNPLNIVRGLAQMISRREDSPAEVRTRAREIIDETDRITGQLNEFINYSRPREVRRVAVNLNALVAEVVRALNYDLEEKKVQIRVQAEPLTIQADEQLLRQALFNLAINAIQAVPANAEIWIRAGRRNGSQAFVEVADNGPGVLPEHRSELFKPYFTTHEQGTGLGLAVVQQIVLAHGWDIECVPNQPSGAIFRISHIRASGKS